jgi:hypothetical protein
MAMVLVVSVITNVVALTTLIKLRRNKTLRRIEQADKVLKDGARQMRKVAEQRDAANYSILETRFKKLPFDGGSSWFARQPW